MSVWTSVLVVVFGSSGLLTLIFAAQQLGIRRRAHILELYRQAFTMIDSPDVRAARQFVYKVDRDAFEREHWVDIDSHCGKDGYADWQENRARAERVARSFDQLGLLVREGLLPINVVARFYASPCLRCWYRLSPYINADRSSRGRNQPGHMWEWENLVFRIIIPGLKRGRGPWRGVSAHDKLEDLAHTVEHEHQSLLKDADYRPRSSLWELGRWYEIWKW
jgi:hypothetical protein